MLGGLYPKGVNARPASHEAAGQALLARIRPRNSTGAIDDQNGRIVLLSVGMSNTTQEFSAFKTVADRDPEKNPKVLIVDGAQGGASADHILADPKTYWNNVEQRLKSAGVTDAQVQTAWIKLADSTPTLPFPADAQKLESDIKTIILSLTPRFPNLRMAYLSSRIYAGYATTSLNPEPYAYQGGFSVKWLIEAQIQGDSSLDFSAGKAPWMAWGPYLWADGLSMRFDGLTWACSELATDGTHPSPTGQMKVAQMLLDFFKGDTTTRPWFVGAVAQIPPAPLATSVINAASYIPQVALASIAMIKGTDLAGDAASAPALPLPFGLAGTAVTVGGEPAPLYYVSGTQINCVVPPTASGTDVVVTRQGAQQPGLSVANFGFNTEGLLTLDASGQGPVAARHLNGDWINQQSPARRNETIMVVGTGYGVRNPSIKIADVLPLVKIGGASATVKYFGPGGGYPGLDQLNIVIPPDAPTGPAVPLTLQLGTFTSNTVSLPVSQ